jgi:DNA-directed RNA polymerase specialized sigma24 family protein
MTEALFQTHAGFVAGFVARFGVKAEEIDETVLRVFVEAHRRGGGPPPPATPAVWLAAIAFQTATKEKAAAHGGRVPATVNDFLRTLDPENRALFILFELEGETSHAIAAAFGLPLDVLREKLRANQRDFRGAFGDKDQPASAALSMRPSLVG